MKQRIWFRLSDPRTLLLGSGAMLLLALLLGGVVFGVIGKATQYIEQWIGVMLGLVAGIGSSAVFAYAQMRGDEARQEQVYAALTKAPYSRSQSEEYTMDGKNTVILLTETLGKTITINRKPGTHTVVALVDYGSQRGTVHAELTFEPHQQLHAEGSFQYIEGPCAPGHGQYRMDVLEGGKRLRVRWSSVSGIRGHEGWEMWTRRDADTND